MAESPDRRVFLKRSALALSALAAGCGGEEGRDADEASGRAGDAPRRFFPDPELLRAAGEALLPAEIGEAGREEAVSGFEAWLRDYAPVPERVHGYGSQEIRYGPPDPAPRWAAQLEALELESRARHGTGFASLADSARRELLERALADALGDLPSRPGALEAEHVAVGLLAWFYGSPRATDLCYRRRIGRLSCRPLAESGRVPPPLPDGPAVGDGAGERPGTRRGTGDILRSGDRRRAAGSPAGPRRPPEPGS